MGAGLGAGGPWRPRRLAPFHPGLNPRALSRFASLTLFLAVFPFVVPIVFYSAGNGDLYVLVLVDELLCQKSFKDCRNKRHVYTAGVLMPFQ